MTDTNAHETGEALLGLTPDHTIEEAVFQALGAASVCWETPEGAGVFDSDRAKAIGEELMAWLRRGGPTTCGECGRNMAEDTAHFCAGCWNQRLWSWEQPVDYDEVAHRAIDHQAQRRGCNHEFEESDVRGAPWRDATCVHCGMSAEIG